ncbi:hypothetical protein GCM10020258_54460 [Sphingomonas yabuuchiae]
MLICRVVRCQDMDVAPPLGIKPMYTAQPTNQRLSQQASFTGIVTQSPILKDGQIKVRDIVGRRRGETPGPSRTHDPRWCG